jgi:hypothetical protein
MTQKPQVGDKWFRYHAAFNQWDERPYVYMSHVYVQAVTPSGVWLHPYEPYTNQGGELVVCTDRAYGARWQYVWSRTGETSNAGRHKPTVEEAWRSFQIRCSRRLGHAQREMTLAQWAYDTSRAPAMPEEVKPAPVQLPELAGAFYG